MLLADAVEQLHGFGLLLNAIRFRAELQLHDGGFRRAFFLDGRRLRFHTLRLGNGLLLQDIRFGGSCFLSRIRCCDHHFRVCQTDRSVIRSLCFGQHLGRLSVLLGGRTPRFCFNDDLL